MARLVVVSNRVAVPDGKSGGRAGGLEVAVKAALHHRQGVWFGWSGKISRKGEAAETATIRRDKIDYVVTSLGAEDYKEYYNGFANRVLWPVLHYRFDLAEFSRRDLSGYLRVNEHFANELDKLLRPDDVVWVHDYHLIPLARALRSRGHRNRIGYFLHIPCPPPEVLTALPNHERLIPTLGDYDLVGFQTGDDAFNFSRYLTRECGLHSHDFSFMVGEREVRVDAFPVGIETEHFARTARRAIKSGFVQKVVGSLNHRPQIIGVDRLDYSKGLNLRLEAFEHFLGTFPGWVGKVTYLQITPKSRSEIPEYMQMEQMVSQLAGRINGAYGEADWTPIRYLNRAYSRTALAGLYRASRVGLVTPLRDGMNLVAKEYVAAQDPDDPGVLVLSRFAGAANECKEALQVNPYDTEAVAAAIDRALSMPLEERRARHQPMYETLLNNDIAHWAERFLSVLTRPPRAASWPLLGLAANG
ncbi:MAG TPA: alpha,alpha-trehalose-phosphate synthase (UDP-forming) [Xanthobacteraceae bacterium]|nr:alpha,alpha-trehalose-phosphate synthase (UDP-forming) [Xanthobacteraceae bacterium]